MKVMLCACSTLRSENNWPNTTSTIKRSDTIDNVQAGDDNMYMNIFMCIDTINVRAFHNNDSGELQWNSLWFQNENPHDDSVALQFNAMRISIKGI